jgi:hypothetical protein
MGVTVPLIRTTFRHRPRPSEGGHPDPRWHSLTPLGWHALADPSAGVLWPDDTSDVVPWWPFATALELLVYGTGWPRLDVGALAWRAQGYRPLSPTLQVVAEILGDRLDELTAWLCTSVFAAPARDGHRSGRRRRAPVTAPRCPRLDT